MIRFVRAPIKDPPIIADGTTDTFSTAGVFRPGSLTVWVNGLRKDDALDDGVVELPSAFRLQTPPRDGDTIQAEYDAPDP